MGDKNPSGTQFLKVMHKGNSANHILTFPDMIKNVYFSVYLEDRYMKIRAIISGPSVHNVGYRVHLLKMALTEGIEGFSATNTVGPDDIQQVLVLAEGDDETIRDFSSLIKTSTPPHATVVSVDIEPYSKRIIRIMDFLHLIQVEQLDKGIPAILSIQSSQEKMLEKQTQMLEKQDQTIGEIKALRSDLKTEMNDRFNRMEQELRTIKEALHRSGIMA